MSVAPLLSTLRDVEGVMGSFVVDLLGQVRARDMPAMFDDHALEEAAPRIARLKDALETQGEQIDSVTLSHGPHLLFLRTAGEIILCVLVRQDVSAPSLRMGTSLVLKRLPDVLAAAAQAASKASTLPPTLRPAPPASPSQAAFSPVLPPPAPVPVIAPPPPPPPRVSGPPPVPAPLPLAAPVVVQEAPHHKIQRFFRGRLIEDD
ncbi:MAG: hypothetical protein IPL19_33595 [Sandaracinaceae bacterium]|jgi:predicted regulator of Ras-like GTPase activity (Roadblock/LC7/MglB family)|nr:hypothetical protein [Sandaracinaceae bacterium]MBK7773873.1 hypothetical protein [Sandaracinaceae bacterium]MBK8412898.1 hypothetical protein [Sandaracinaceae bacterium]